MKRQNIGKGCYNTNFGLVKGDIKILIMLQSKVTWDKNSLNFVRKSTPAYKMNCGIGNVLNYVQAMLWISPQIDHVILQGL